MTGTIESLMAMWLPMTAAMMTASVLPFFVSLARRATPWPPATAVAAAVYMLVWSVFAVGVYLVSSLLTERIHLHARRGQVAWSIREAPPR